MYNATPVENTVTKPLKDILERVCDTARGRKRSQVAISLMNEVVLWQKKVKVFENEMIPESKCLYLTSRTPGNTVRILGWNQDHLGAVATQIYIETAKRLFEE